MDVMNGELTHVAIKPKHSLRSGGEALCARSDATADLSDAEENIGAVAARPGTRISNRPLPVWPAIRTKLEKPAYRKRRSRRNGSLVRAKGLPPLDASSLARQRREPSLGDRNRIVMKSFLDALYAFIAFVKSITYLFSMLPQSSNPILTANFLK
jgi:hypothetical protein